MPVQSAERTEDGFEVPQLSGRRGVGLAVVPLGVHPEGGNQFLDGQSGVVPIAKRNFALAGEVLLDQKIILGHGLGAAVRAEVMLPAVSDDKSQVLGLEAAIRGDTESRHGSNFHSWIRSIIGTDS